MNPRIWDRIKDWVLFFTLLLIAAVLLLTQNQPITQGLRATALEGTAWVEARLSWAGRYFSALEENALLREENIQLSGEVARVREAQIENDRLRRLLGFQDTTALELRTARVLSKDLTRQRNLITIDAGRNDSVEVDMAVIDERGIVGKVVAVSENYARVMPYLNTDFRVPAKILPRQTTGVVTWDGERRNRLVMEFVSRTESVLPGQLVVTSGYSATFPSGYAVGFVDSVLARPGRNEKSIYLTPISPLDNAEYVFVVLSRPDPERLDLENEPFR